MPFHIPLDSKKPKNLAVKLNKGGERSLRSGHPWIFSNSIEKITQGGEAGDICVVYLKKTNKVGGIGLYDPDSPIRIKMLYHRGAANLDAEFLRFRIGEAWNKRQALLKATDAVRVIFGENDGLPGLIADLYNKVLVVKLYSAIWYPFLGVILEILINCTGAETVVARLSRHLQRNQHYPFDDGKVLFGELKNPEVVFKEYGVWFTADVIHGHKTGYFLDHRQNRREVGERSKGKRVLDVFSYAGGFSVHALAGGATEVTSVDISEQALEMAERNADLNDHDGTHYTLSGDAFEALPKLVDEGKTYDIVVIDPPSFAKSEKEIDKAKYKYRQLADLGSRLTAKGGLLLLASCSSRVTADEFFRINAETLKKTGRNFRLEKKTFHDLDHPVGFPEGAYLKCGYYLF